MTPNQPQPVQFAHKLSIKLTESNFLLWIQQVEGVILANKLHRFVANPNIPPKFNSEADRALNNVTAEYERWIVQDQMLFTWMLASLSEAILPRVIGCKHSHQVWDKIHKHFHSIMKARVRQLRSELKTTKKGTRTISEYVLRIKAIVDSLIAIGDPISDQEHADAILEGLPEEFNPFVMMIYSRPDSLAISDIEALLLVQEAQLDKFRNDLQAPAISANVAYTAS
ncbi:retrovirus-related Pol polyprotein from transposon TNT 1-99, partial [Trifolium medium]|nr:retrovirus-related Pol polyprotein from transposon TNT 1-99 [Trifolium medium]